MEHKQQGEFNFRQWIKEQPQSKYELVIEDDDHYRMHSDYGLAEVNFYPDDIVEISITSFKDQEPKYYLHFQLKDEEHTKTLFYEMVDALDALKAERDYKILLSCSSGFTTSYFAGELNETAERHKLNYSFDAVSYLELYDHAQAYDAILLAPQIGYMKEKLATALPQKLVLSIPTAMFAAYDALELFDWLEEQLKRHYEKPKPKCDPAKCRKGLSDDQTILCLAELYDGNKVTLYNRVYDHGDVVLDDVVIKTDTDTVPLWDTIDYCLHRFPNIELITIAFPCEVREYNRIFSLERGWNDFPLADEIKKRCGIDTLVFNNVNAAAVGYHVEHPQYQNITFHSQPYGKPNGGQGNIVNGKLINGMNGIGGEVKYFLKRVQFSDEIERLARCESGQMELVFNALLPTISLLGPEVIVLRTPMVCDMSALRNRLARFLPEECIPELEYISDVNELIFTGSLQLSHKRHEELSR